MSGVQNIPGTLLIDAAGQLVFGGVSQTGVLTFNAQVLVIPSPAGGIPGTPTNDNAAAGNIGELLTASLLVGAATGLVTATAKDVITIALTGGDWEISGVIDFHPAATTNATLLLSGASLVANTLGADDTFSSQVFLTAGQVTVAGDYRQIIPLQRVSVVPAGAVAHLVAQATFTVAAMTAYGTIRARRVR
jgi:hypothetical protein